jgi:hypothetical protein
LGPELFFKASKVIFTNHTSIALLSLADDSATKRFVKKSAHFFQKSPNMEPN